MYVPITDLQSFRQLIILEETRESQWLDFKAVLNHQGRKDQEELSRDVAQFANTDGGVLLIGISEALDPRGTGLKVAKGIVPVKDPPCVEQWVHNALTNCLYPSTIPLDVRMIALPEGVVVAINVPPYPDIVVVCGNENRTHEFFRRTSLGKKPMSFAEVELHQMNTRRAARIAIQEATAQVKSADQGWRVELIPPPPVFRYPDGMVGEGAYSVYLQESTDRVFCLRFEHPDDHREDVLHVPYSVVRDAWVTREGVIGLLLHVKVWRRWEDHTWSFTRYKG